jgi:ABC-2 type transport system permease protein
MSETLVMISRSVRISRRTVDALILSLALPVMLMLVFVYLFGGTMAPGGDYVDYVVPGVILVCVGFASSQTAVSVAQDMRGGIVDRFQSMNVSGAAQLTGHVAASVLRNTVATAAVVAVATAIGFRPHATVLEWLATAGILLAFVVALSFLSAVLGLLTGEPEAASGLGFFVSFLAYPSSAFVAVETISPGWLQAFARHQPVTAVVESMRGLLLGGPVGEHAWPAVAWSAGIVAASVLASVGLMSRRSR